MMDLPGEDVVKVRIFELFGKDIVEYRQNGNTPFYPSEAASNKTVGSLVLDHTPRNLSPNNS